MPHSSAQPQPQPQVVHPHPHHAGSHHAGSHHASKHPFFDALIAALPSAIISILGVSLSISFFIGSAKNDLQHVADNQDILGERITALSQRFATVDKNQAVMASKIESMTIEIGRLNQGWANLNEDMKCIRMVVASSKSGDITKC